MGRMSEAIADGSSRWTVSEADMVGEVCRHQVAKEEGCDAMVEKSVGVGVEESS